MGKHLRLISGHDSQGLGPKLGAAFAYILLGWIVATHSDMGSLITIFMLLGFVYWLVVARRRQSVSFFLRYHLLQALVLNLLISTVLWLLMETFRLFLTIPLIDVAATWIQTILFQPMIPRFSLSVVGICVLLMAFSMAFDCLRGRVTQLAWVSDAVRQWV